MKNCWPWKTLDKYNIGKLQRSTEKNAFGSRNKFFRFFRTRVQIRSINELFISHYFLSFSNTHTNILSHSFTLIWIFPSDSLSFRSLFRHSFEVNVSFQFYDEKRKLQKETYLFSKFRKIAIKFFCFVLSHYYFIILLSNDFIL